MIGEVHFQPQSQSYPATGQYQAYPELGSSSAPHGIHTGDNNVGKSEQEDIAELEDVSKELARSNCIQADQSEYSLNKPVYIGGNSADLNKKGYVTVDDITIADKLAHAEFIDLLKSFLQAKHLLFTCQELSKKQEKRKRTLLGLLCNLNWRVRDVFLQARLIKSMDERLQMLKGYVVGESED